MTIPPLGEAISIASDGDMVIFFFFFFFLHASSSGRPNNPPQKTELGDQVSSL